MPPVIKKSRFISLANIYALLGVKSKTLTKWKDSIVITGAKLQQRHTLINRAANLFSLTNEEKEKLANAAGLTLVNFHAPSDVTKYEIADEFTPNAVAAGCATNTRLHESNTEFSEHFTTLLSTYQGKLNELCNAALVSDRMFRHIKAGKHLRKESLLALLIAMELSLPEIQLALSKAGYILSKSIPGDVVIMWMMENDLAALPGALRILRANEALDSFDLPLLMTNIR